MRRFLLLLVAIGFNGSLHADDPFFFKKGDRILFLGDSITEQYEYSSYVELYLTTRFPDWNLTFLNAGIGGDTALGGANRFQSHVLDEKPTALTINFGMNDGGYGKFNPKANEQYVKNTTAMLEMANKAGIRVALVSPNAVDRRIQDRFKVYLETQKEFYAPLKDIAEKHRATFVDQYAMTRTVLEKLEADKATKVIPFGDGFHTSQPGGLLMAHSILIGLHAPAKVSDLTIDISKNESKSERCKVNDLQAKSDSVSFERTDESLPVPVQQSWVSLLPFLNDLKDFNYYGLRINGLDKGKYALSIDGKELGNYSSDQLAEGINLGNLTKGPIHAQGQKVYQALAVKNQIVHQRFRGVKMYSSPDWLSDLESQIREKKAKELEKRMEQINAKQLEVYKLAQPTPHKFNLTKVPD